MLPPQMSGHRGQVSAVMLLNGFSPVKDGVTGHVHVARRRQERELPSRPRGPIGPAWSKSSAISSWVVSRLDAEALDVALPWFQSQARPREVHAQRPVIPHCS